LPADRAATANDTYIIAKSLVFPGQLLHHAISGSERATPTAQGQLSLQTDATSLTQMESQLEAQQNESAAQIELTHEVQPPTSLAPLEH
jgi:hypothetical protein